MIAASNWVTADDLVGDLLRDGESLLRQRNIAAKIRLRVGQVCLIARQVRFGLLERRLEGARIELGDQVPGCTVWPSTKPILLDRSGYLGMHVHDVVRGHRADAGHHDRHVGDLDLLCNNGHGRRRRRLRRAFRGLRVPGSDAAQDGQHAES